MTIPRYSPSGKPIDFEGIIDSDDIVNDSTVEGDTLTQALDNLQRSDLRYFDRTHSPVALWNFDNTLADASGNGFDLSVEAGAAAFADIVPGRAALRLPIGARFGRATTAALLLQGAMTIEAIVQCDNSPPAPATATSMAIAGYGGSGETEPANFQWLLSMSSTTTASIPQNLVSFWENAAGVDVLFNTSGPQSLPPIHNIMYVASTRSATGVMQSYVNGTTFNAPSAALPLPTGGSTARVVVGVSSPTSVVVDSFVIMSIKIIARALSAAEIRAEYNFAMGPRFGLLPSLGAAPTQANDGFEQRRDSRLWLPKVEPAASRATLSSHGARTRQSTIYGARDPRRGARLVRGAGPARAQL